MLSLRRSLPKENEISSFIGMVSFLCTCVAPIFVRGLWEFLHTLIIILIQLKFFIHLFIPNMFFKFLSGVLSVGWFLIRLSRYHVIPRKFLTSSMDSGSLQFGTASIFHGFDFNPFNVNKQQKNMVSIFIKFTLLSVEFNPIFLGSLLYFLKGSVLFLSFSSNDYVISFVHI